MATVEGEKLPDDIINNGRISDNKVVAFVAPPCRGTCYFPRCLIDDQ